MSVVRAAPKEFVQLREYIRASQELNGWITGARMIALLNGVVDSGVLDALGTPKTAEKIAAATSMNKNCIVDLCQALEVHGVVQRNGEYYHLTPNFELLASTEAAVPLANVIRQTMVMIRALQTVAPSNATYTNMPSEDVLAMAEGAGISSLSSAPHVSAESMGKTLPEVEVLWRAGVPHLEVGCGVGNSLFGIVTTYPEVTAVGIEIDELIATEAERRADLLGITDRVELRRMDACELKDEESYETIQWSQFFFPAATRPVVLNAMHRALKPGGYLFMPWFGLVGDTLPRRRVMLRMALRALITGGFSFLSFLNDAIGETTGRRKKERRFAALQRLLFNRWGVPVRTIGELESEVRESGFSIIRVTPSPVSQFAFTRGFLLARRDVS